MSFVVGGLPSDPVEREAVVAALIAERLGGGLRRFDGGELAAVVEMVGAPPRPRPAPRPPVRPRPGGPSRPPRFWGRLFGALALVVGLAGCGSSGSDEGVPALKSWQVNLPDGRVVVCVTGNPGPRGGTSLDCDWLTARRP